MKALRAGEVKGRSRRPVGGGSRGHGAFEARGTRSTNAGNAALDAATDAPGAPACRTGDSPLTDAIGRFGDSFDELSQLSASVYVAKVAGADPQRSEANGIGAQIVDHGAQSPDL